MQTQWPGLGPNFDLSSLDAASGEGRQLWPGDPAPGASPTLPSDAIGRSWWSCGTANANAGNPFGGLFGSGAGIGNGSSGTLVGLVVMLVFISLFSQEPVLFLTATALWVGICTAGAARNRNFRSYGFVLSGYTAALIGVPVAQHADAAFLTALGICLVALLVSATAFCVLFPLWFFRYARSFWLGLDYYFDPPAAAASAKGANQSDSHSQK